MPVIEREIANVAQQYGLKIDPSRLVRNLSVGEQQRVEIVKALFRGVNLLILDEPTAVLTPQETQELFKTLNNLTQDGLSIIFITHKLNEVLSVANRVSVLRDGRLIATKRVEETDRNELAFMMVDRHINFVLKRPEVPVGKPILTVEKLTVEDKSRFLLKDVSLQVCCGEILGIAGVAGNGQNELALSITGLIHPSAGRIILNGKDVTRQPVRKLNEAGLGHIPEDRQGMGLVIDFSVADNLILQKYYAPPFTGRFGLFNPQAIADHAQRLIGTFNVRTRTAQTKVSHLSGGNQQRVILAREINNNPDLLVAVQPTRGLDIGATEYIHRQLLAQRARGAAVLLIATELEEILALSDRIDIIYEGKIVGEVTAKNADIIRIGKMMAGVSDDDARRYSN